jgi:hypothetical protein
MRLGQHSRLGAAKALCDGLAGQPEVRFTAEPDGFTRVDLEHRCFERHGAGFETMRTATDSPQGWKRIARAIPRGSNGAVSVRERNRRDKPACSRG